MTIVSTVLCSYAVVLLMLTLFVNRFGQCHMPAVPAQSPTEAQVKEVLQVYEILGK